MSIGDFHQFLKQARANRRASRQIVLGNESADLDSVVSSLMVAYYHDIARPSGNGPPLAVINIPRQALRIRADILFLLDRLKIDPANLTFSDEIDLSDPNSSPPFSLTLVDHNQLAPRQRHLKNRVIEIIDHHVETGRYDARVKKTIQPVGSTATLVWHLFAQTFAHKIDRDLARFLLAPIIIDTTLLNDPQKATTLDRLAVDELQTQAQINVKVFYDLLLAKKIALSHLTAREILQKDFKAWRWAHHQTGGISSTPQLIETLLETKPGLLAAAQKLAQENRFDFFMIMGSGNTPDPRRDLLCWSWDPKWIEPLIAHLEKSAIGLKKGSLKIRTGPVEPPFYYFQQQNPLFSRKKMAAELHAFFGIH